LSLPHYPSLLLPNSTLYPPLFFLLYDCASSDFFLVFVTPKLENVPLSVSIFPFDDYGLSERLAFTCFEPSVIPSPSLFPPPISLPYVGVETSLLGLAFAVDITLPFGYRSLLSPFESYFLRGFRWYRGVRLFKFLIPAAVSSI